MWTQDLYKRAIDFAARAHGEQKVPGSGFPYVTHVAKVAMEAMSACVVDPSADADLAMACALLHDCIEDAGITHAQVKAEFGEKVADGVLALSKNEALPKAERMEDALSRIRKQPREVWMVKLADRITNLEPPPSHWSLEKRRGYLEEAKVIRERLRGASEPLEKRIEEKITAYAAYCRE